LADPFNRLPPILPYLTNFYVSNEFGIPSLRYGAVAKIEILNGLTKAESEPTSLSNEDYEVYTSHIQAFVSKFNSGTCYESNPMYWIMCLHKAKEYRGMYPANWKTNGDGTLTGGVNGKAEANVKIRTTVASVLD
jgi:hypothetical protein